MRFLPMQPGDMPDTESDESRLANVVGYSPAVSIEEGVARFAQWYLDYMGYSEKLLHQPAEHSVHREALLA